MRVRVEFDIGAQRAGEHLRPRTTKNQNQHRQTIEQLRPQDLQSYLEWFRTLPLWLELDGLRVVHACWDEQAMSRVSQGLSQHKGVTGEFLQSACRNVGDLFAPVEIILKGKEAPLPEGVSFQDKDGHVRYDVRVRWYLPPDGETYGSYAFQSDDISCDLALDAGVVEAAQPYPATDKPVFIGHYSLSAQRPELLADNVACLDYSVAKGGFLCAYRWQGEHRLSRENFVWIGSQRE